MKRAGVSVEVCVGVRAAVVVAGGVRVDEVLAAAVREDEALRVDVGVVAGVPLLELVDELLEV